MKADMLRKLLQAGALAAEAGSRGSAGNIASKIVDSGLDLSDFRKRNNKPDKKNDKGPNNGKGPPSTNEEKNPDMPQ
tara:strand:- start:69 stop:299 length:231 start_codon:yes stop_codon:yes gene_type:complete